MSDVMFRMTNSFVIRDASGRFACPNVICWHRYSTGLHPPKNAKISDDSRYTKCPNCHIDIDWGWIIDELPSDN